jgi:hypothetical protein
LRDYCSVQSFFGSTSKRTRQELSWQNYFNLVPVQFDAMDSPRAVSTEVPPVYTQLSSEVRREILDSTSGATLMKKAAFLAVAVFAFSLSAVAGTVTGVCTPFTFPFTAGMGAGTLSCPSFASLGVAGAIDISGATLNLFADYQAGNPATVNKITDTFNTSSGVTGLNPGISWALGNTTTMSVTGGFSSGGSVPVSPNPDAAISAAFGTAASLAQWTAFNVGVSSELNSGSVTTSSAGATITYTYDTPQTTTPEPGSMALFCGGLLAASLIGRKKLARR